MSAYTQLCLPPADSQARHQLLLTGGAMHLAINEAGKDYENGEYLFYSFPIHNADSYEAPYKRLGRMP